MFYLGKSNLTQLSPFNLLMKRNVQYKYIYNANLDITHIDVSFNISYTDDTNGVLISFNGVHSTVGSDEHSEI